MPRPNSSRAAAQRQDDAKEHVEYLESCPQNIAADHNDSEEPSTSRPVRVYADGMAAVGAPAMKRTIVLSSILERSV